MTKVWNQLVSFQSFEFLISKTRLKIGLMIKDNKFSSTLVIV